MKNNEDTEVKHVGTSSVVGDSVLMSNVTHAQPIKRRVMLQVATVDLCNGLKQTKANVLFDSASTNSWITEDKAKEIGLKNKSGVTKIIPVKTFGGGEPLKVHGYDAQIGVLQKPEVARQYGPNSKPKQIPIQVTVIPRIVETLHRDTVPKDDWKMIHNIYLNALAPGAVAEQPSEVPIDMIIGQDSIWSFLCPSYINGNTVDTVVDLPSGLKLLPSEVGYILAGATIDSNWCVSSSQEISKFIAMRNLSDQPRTDIVDSKLCQEFQSRYGSAAVYAAIGYMDMQGDTATLTSLASGQELNAASQESIGKRLIIQKKPIDRKWRETWVRIVCRSAPLERLQNPKNRSGTIVNERLLLNHMIGDGWISMEFDNSTGLRIADVDSTQINDTAIVVQDSIQSVNAVKRNRSVKCLDSMEISDQRTNDIQRAKDSPPRKRTRITQSLRSHLF